MSIIQTIQRTIYKAIGQKPCFVCQKRLVSETPDHAILFNGKYGNSYIKKTKYVCNNCQRLILLNGDFRH